MTETTDEAFVDDPPASSAGGTAKPVAPLAEALVEVQGLSKHYGPIRAVDGISFTVRRGDILNGLPWKHGMWPSKIEPDELYLKHLEIEQPDTVLVFSDLDECIARLRKEHANIRGIKELISVED